MHIYKNTYGCYIRIYVHIYIRIHTYIHTYTYIRIHTYVYIHTYTYTHTYVHTHIHSAHRGFADTGKLRGFDVRQRYQPFEFKVLLAAKRNKKIQSKKWNIIKKNWPTASTFWIWGLARCGQARCSERKRKRERNRASERQGENM